MPAPPSFFRSQRRFISPREVGAMITFAFCSRAEIFFAVAFEVRPIVVLEARSSFKTLALSGIRPLGSRMIRCRFFQDGILRPREARSVKEGSSRRIVFTPA